jgi:DNA-binding transcriptional MerR regulator
MPYKAKEIERKYYNIGDVAAMFNVATSLIRYWETEFDNIAPRKNTKGNRLYTLKDIESIRQVYHLVKEKGYTLQGAKEYIRTHKSQGTNTPQQVAVEKLKTIKSFLEELHRKL